MRYMLLLYLNEQSITESERSKCYAASAELAQQLHQRGEYRGASPLQPTIVATCVRVVEGKPVVTDGPFAETREQLGGYYLIETADLDEAIRVAAHIPVARFGTVEIRPVMQIPGLPNS